MKTLPTQFDDKRLASAVATPTCSSCCCCCCCLATSIASSSLLAQRVAKEGKRYQIRDRVLLTITAALFMPLVGLLVYFGFWTINMLLRTCVDRIYPASNSFFGGQHYSVCTSPNLSFFMFPLIVIAPFLILFYLYSRVHIEKPAKRAMLVTVLIAVAFALELFVGVIAVLSGIGIVYLLMVPVIIGWITVWYHHNIGQEGSITEVPTPSPNAQVVYVSSTEAAKTPVQPASQAQGATWNYEPPAKPHEPTQQNPPTQIG